jgi:hypothetical protein
LWVQNINSVVVAESCAEKNAAVAEIAVKLLARLIENLGGNIVKLQPETLQKVMKALTVMIDGKRQNTKNWALEICMYVFNLIGSQNYLSLMTYVLTQEEIQVAISLYSDYDSIDEPKKPKELQIDDPTIISRPEIKKKHAKTTEITTVRTPLQPIPSGPEQQPQHEPIPTTMVTLHLHILKLTHRISSKISPFSFG